MAGHLKTDMLMALLRQAETESVLVFTRTKHRAKRLGEKLGAAGYRSASLQGNLSQNRRKAALDGFRNGTVQILVATDIAARGIDVTQISHVINYDIPDTPEAYIHRIGRTGRAARTGDAFTLATDEDREMVLNIERLLALLWSVVAWKISTINNRPLKGWQADLRAGRDPRPRLASAPLERNRRPSSACAAPSPPVMARSRRSAR